MPVSRLSCQTTLIGHNDTLPEPWADHWFVSFTVEMKRQVPASNCMPSVVGVDVGIRHLAVLSTGMTVANPRALQHSLGTLRRLNRELARRKLDRGARPDPAAAGPGTFPGGQPAA